MSFLAWSPAPKPKTVVSVRVPHHLPASANRPSINFLDPVTFLGLEKTLLRVSGGFRFRSSCGATWLVARRDSLSMELGAKFRFLE